MVDFKFVVFCCSFLFGSNFLVDGKTSLKNQIELCGSENEIHLTADGENSSVTILLNPSQNSLCRLKVVGPYTHILNVQFVESDEDIHPPFFVNKSLSNTSCMLSLFLPQNKKTAVWRGDPCSEDSLSKIGLQTPELKFVWTSSKEIAQTRGRKIVITAVGQGEICKRQNQHTCMKISFEPILCVSDSLLCNGHHDCPKGAQISDEDDVLCRSRLLAHSSWEKLAVEIFRKFKPPPELVDEKWLQEKLEEIIAADEIHKWQDSNEQVFTTQRTTKPQKTRKPKNEISSAFSQYGPWGYLMLGMLISGTVVLFCGIWECCFSKSKPPTNTTTNQVNPSVESIPEEVVNPEPPNYDDLDQPPSYSVLFPNYKLDITLRNGNEEQRRNSSLHCNDVPSVDVSNQNCNSNQNYTEIPNQNYTEVSIQNVTQISNRGLEESRAGNCCVQIHVDSNTLDVNNVSRHLNGRLCNDNVGNISVYMECLESLPNTQNISNTESLPSAQRLFNTESQHCLPNIDISNQQSLSNTESIPNAQNFINTESLHVNEDNLSVKDINDVESMNKNTECNYNRRGNQNRIREREITTNPLRTKIDNNGTDETE